MNPTEARLATLRAFYQWLSFAGDLAPIKTAIVAEIAAIEAEARVAPAADSPAPPPARPKRVKVTEKGTCSGSVTIGTEYPVIRWSDNGLPTVINDDGKELTMYGNAEGFGECSKWVPADEPDWEEAREREARSSLPTLSPREGGATSFTEEDA